MTDGAVDGTSDGPALAGAAADPGAASLPVLYREAGRGYASVAYFAALLGAGFVLDLFLGGGVAHLPGWIGAFVIVIGLNLLVIHAARVTKTLTVDADEVRIGDETVDRARIVGGAAGIDPELPVLGWLTAAPRGVDGVTVRLDDGRAVVVPSRHPQRLLAALGLAGAIAGEAQVEVRGADEDDLPLLDEIDERAEALFRIGGYDLPEVPFVDRGTVAIFVVGRPPVGFVRLTAVDGLAHLDEIAVIPGSMRQGLGGRLIERACEWARAAGHDAITLTTYADVPWNGPMYARRGWVELADPTPGLIAIRESEIAAGLDDVGPRIVMRREL